MNNFKNEIALWYDSGTANNGNPIAGVAGNSFLSYSSWTKNQSLGSQLSCNFTKS